VGDVISGIGFGVFGPGYWSLGLNHKRQFFDSSFYWKLGYNWIVTALHWLSSISGSKVMA